MTASSRRVLAHVRLTHPFPSLLDGLVVAGAALVAGGPGATALRLGASMVLLQASVGTLNDLIDAPRDAGHKPGKPIPAGLVRPSTARPIALVTGISGVALATPSGPFTVALAVSLLLLGYAYDLWFKGTAWSWVPFAIAIPLFPTYGWLGAAGGVPPVWALLLPTSMVAGAALALGNAAVDVERDRAAGGRSVATVLGHRRAAALGAGLASCVVTAAIASIAVFDAATGPWLALVAVGSAMALAGGLAILRPHPGTRERGWKIECVGIAIVAGGWLAAVRDAGLA